MGETKLVKALVTGFEGWLGKTNPAGVIAKSLDGAKINDLEVVGREIPEDFTKTTQRDKAPYRRSSA
ncbi:hypothetical protein B9Q02_07680 [Candidatus Marsarchaeota G1 archaeon BE_D]|uniref:Uncharacterized protein n=1 Tax=Candidatus Marsarchaeota G1 archaeon BE_D TaxID=1978156 RepID=A0A2R6AFE5_9ARCH|nr:MAG: hypothetical protein B9Q02_07680 [Candidatus Marsarchaeota G1 archaeon BE_D]